MERSSEIHVREFQSHENFMADFIQARFSLDPDFAKSSTHQDVITSEYPHSIFVVFKNNVPVGRAVLYENPHLSYLSHRSACVGNYDCINEEQSSQLLLSAVKERAQKKGFTFLLGPMNGSTWETYRWSTAHHHPHFLSEPVHPLYYNTQWEHAGFQVISHYHSYLDSEMTHDFPKVLQKERAFQQMGMTFESLNLSSFETELTALYPLMCRAFANNFLYTPISESYFVKKYNHLLPLIQPRWAIKAVDHNGNIKGIILSFPDALNPIQKNLIVKTLLTDPSERKWAGLGSVLCNQIVRRASQAGFTSVIAAFIHSRNVSLNIAKNFQSTPYKHYILMGSEI